MKYKNILLIATILLLCGCNNQNKDKDINSYRLENVSRMVEKVHKTCKKYNNAETIAKNDL